MDRILYTLLFFFFSSLFCESSFGQVNEPNRFILNKSALGKSKIERSPKENPKERAAYEHKMLADPRTGKIPKGIEMKEAFFSALLPKMQYGVQKGIQGRVDLEDADRWQERGPYFVGGRTRAIAIDITNENIILAGGVAGGVWRSEDGGSTWVKTTSPSYNHSVTSIAQDSRPGYTHIWYYSAGEQEGASSGGFSGDSSHGGGGVYKSTDGGRTWLLLLGTSNEDGFEGVRDEEGGSFDWTNRIVVNPLTGSVFVATFRGISGSRDGGDTWDYVLRSTDPVGQGPTNTSEIEVTSTGILFATISYEGVEHSGIYVSLNDGRTWQDITPRVGNGDPFTILENYSRTTIGIAPSDESIVYFFTSGRVPRNIDQNVECINVEDLLGGSERYALYKLEWELSGDGRSVTTSWVDRSRNLPEQGTLGLGQGNYNKFVRVKPDDPSTVFIGSVNLFRSTDGFASSESVQLIGGYNFNKQLFNDPSVGILYKNHHPDNHDLVFFPSDANKAISVHDGGVTLALDISEDTGGEEPVSWESLNVGYYTTQAYSVAINDRAGSNDIVAGFQDNGTFSSDSYSPNRKWRGEGGGDGGLCEITTIDGFHMFSSSYYASITRKDYDESGNVIGETSLVPPIPDFIRPPQDAGVPEGDLIDFFYYNFIHPYTYDKEEDILYFPIKTHVSFLNNASTSQGGTNWADFQGDNWQFRFGLMNTPEEERCFNLGFVSETTTAIAVSESDQQPKTLYLGTSEGRLFKHVREGNAWNREGDVAGNNFPAGGYISCIAIDPRNSDKVYVVFSNYNVPSIFESVDGGTTWRTVGGNLEDNRDGSGNGPSVRWLSILDYRAANYKKYYVGTSKGLFSTRVLNRDNTEWIQESPDQIGSVVVPMIKTRNSDGYVAVATHATGLYTSYATGVEPLRVANAINDIEANMNQADTKIDLSRVFTDPSGPDENIVVSLGGNTNDNVIDVEVVGQELRVDYLANTTGRSKVTVIGRSGQKEVEESFYVTVTEYDPQVLYDQTNSVDLEGQIVLGTYLIGGDITALDYEYYDDFVVPAGQTWTINSISVDGLAEWDIQLGNRGRLSDINNMIVTIYRSDFESEDAPIGEGLVIERVPSDDISLIKNGAITEIKGNTDDIVVGAGRYWVSIRVNFSVECNVFILDDEGNTVDNDGDGQADINIDNRDQWKLFFVIGTKMNEYPAHAFDGAEYSPVAYGTSFKLFGTSDRGHSAPSNLREKILSPSSVQLEWDDVTDTPNESGYIIEKITGANGGAIEIARVGSDVTTYVDQTGFTAADDTYRYRVKTFGSMSTSRASNTVEVIMDREPVASNWEELQTVSDSEIDLTWTSANSHKEGLRLYRSFSPDRDFVVVRDVYEYEENGAGDYTDNWLLEGHEYYYKLVSYNGEMEEESEVRSAVTDLKGLTGLGIEINEDGQIELSWDDNSWMETGYRVERSETADFSGDVYSELTDEDAESWVDPGEGLVEGIRYYYRIRGVNAIASSAISETSVIAPENAAGAKVAGAHEGDKDLQEASSLGIKVYPNPTESEFLIELGIDFSGEVEAIMYDMTGRRVYSRDLVMKGGLLPINIAHVERGAYTLLLKTPKSNYVHRVVKE